MVKWSELKRASDVVLAVWPHYRPLFERWFMQELIDKGELAPVWRERMVPGDNDTVFADHYPDREAAIAAANALNPTLRQALSVRAMDPVVKRSLELKIDKALQAKLRLQDEEALMLAEALRRHAAAALSAERAKIANGFDLSASTHWGTTKAKIRQILLPRANQLLQLASVQ